MNVFPIYMPSLRARKTDILLLADYFLEKYAVENHKDIKRFSTPAIDMLMEYHWPGNVRELENCIERAVLVCDQGVILGSHLPPTLQTGEQSDTLPVLSLADAVDNLEKEMIIDALKNTRGNMAKAAELVSVDRVEQAATVTFAWESRRQAAQPGDVDVYAIVLRQEETGRWLIHSGRHEIRRSNLE